MKRLFAFLTALMLCFTFAPMGLAEGSATSSEFDPNITISLPDPGWAVSISCAQAGQTLAVGTTITLTANITTEHPEYYDLSSYSVSYNWQAKKGGGDWESVGSGETYSFDLNADNVDWTFRVTVTISE